MTQGIVTVNLQRDGPTTAWGFRLHGGKDIGYPLAIQRVFLGSPSEGELQRGDVILQVGDRDVGGLTHLEAHDVIKHAGNRLKLLVHRLPGAPQSPAAYTPTSPGAVGTGHPLANVASTPASGFKAAAFQPIAPPKPTPPPQSTPTPPPSYKYSPLPTTPVLENHPMPPFFAPDPQTAAAAETYEFHREKTQEKAAIVHQGYRTFPLISPKPKARHDLPIGSYLRHVHDPNYRGLTATPPVHKHFMVNQAAAQTYNPSRTPSVPMQTTTSEGMKIVNLQYNTPLHLYSQQAVADTINEQTGMQPKSKPSRPSGPAPSVAINPSSASAPGPLSPNAAAGSNLAPAKPGTKLNTIVDITLSPTFQMIQEEENRAASPRPGSRTPPSVPRPAAATAATAFKPRVFSPSSDEERINAFGSSREYIHQSGSFRSLMANLAMAGQEF